MPYESIQEAKDAGFPTSAEGIPLTLAQINKLAEIYDAIKERGNVKNAFAVAWTTWKKIYKKEGDKWVEIKKASEAPLIIEGKIPVNVINKNGWGIPDSDVENVTNSLKRAIVRICNRTNDEHSCDDIGDPYSEIGRVIDAKREDNYIRTKVAITDRLAKQKIEDGTWENTWSPYGRARSIENGWTQGLQIESLTLVRNPAWDDAKFNISASASEGVSLELPLISLVANDKNMKAAEWTRAYINDLPDSAFAYIEPCYKRGDTENKNARHLPFKDANGKIDLAHLRNALARVNQLKPICDDTDRTAAIKEAQKVLDEAAKKAKIGEYKEKGGYEKENMVEKNEKTFTQDDVDKMVKAAVEKAKEDADKTLQAALKDMIPKADADKMVKAALEKAKEGDKKEKETYTKEELDAKIKASVEQAKKQTKEEIEREHLTTSIFDLLVNAGVAEETDREKQSETLKAASSEVLQQMLESLTAMNKKLEETVKAAAEGKNIQFPSNNTMSGGAGAYEWDPVKGEFTEVKQ
ncbi:MAG: hypothetical protein ACXQTR_02580 [Candidatus Methanospirareceae archaeon]